MKFFIFIMVVRFVEKKIQTDVSGRFDFDSSGLVFLYYLPRYLQKQEIDTVNLYQHLLQTGDWHQPEIEMHGQQILCPRMCASMCHLEEYEKRFQNIVDSPVEWSKEMLELKVKLEEFLQQLKLPEGPSRSSKFGYCQMIHYRDKNDYLGLHRDRETKPNEVICGISLGGTRRLIFEEMPQFRKGDSRPIRYYLDLNDGDLCLMSFNLCGGKSRFKHGVLKSKQKNQSSRIVVTFRQN